MFNILVAAIIQALFGPNNITPTSVAECNYRLRVARDKYIIRDAEHKHERVKMVRWIAVIFHLWVMRPLG